MKTLVPVEPETEAPRSEVEIETESGEILRIPTRKDWEWMPEGASAAAETLVEATPAKVGLPGYYGLPMLKQPTWRWEIALYFYLGGISAGAFMLASIAAAVDPKRFAPLRRAGYRAALVSFVPCAPLLIADLGDPKRFAYMLRIFKAKSPMSVGSWTLAAYSLPCALMGAVESNLVLRKAAFSRRLFATRWPAVASLVPATMLASYTGVLLASTSTPVWAKSRLLGALFSAAAVSNGAAACSLAMLRDGTQKSEAFRKLQRIEEIANAAEGAALIGYVATAGKAARPLLKGKQSKVFWLGAVGLGMVVPMIIRRRKWRAGMLSRMIKATSVLAGGLALKWAVTYAGKESAEEADAARYAHEA